MTKAELADKIVNILIEEFNMKLSTVDCFGIRERIILLFREQTFGGE